MEQITHVLERTSPMGQKFVGKCMLCGKEGMTSFQANEICPNPEHVSRADALTQSISVRAPIDVCPSCGSDGHCECY
jgi:hypothetical protein